jgi:hypothetical protein
LRGVDRLQPMKFALGFGDLAPEPFEFAEQFGVVFVEFAVRDYEGVVIVHHL